MVSLFPNTRSLPRISPSWKSLSPEPHTYQHSSPETSLPELFLRIWYRTVDLLPVDANVLKHAECHADQHPRKMVVHSPAEHGSEAVNLYVIQPRCMEHVAPRNLRLAEPAPAGRAPWLPREQHARVR
jgi:hypothetical protein